MSNFKLALISLDQALKVRQTVLWPDQPIEFCLVKEDEDETAQHIGAFVENKLVAVASIYMSISGDGSAGVNASESKKSARLRKFAVLKEYQGQGIGTAVLDYLMTILRQSDCQLFWCDARETAIGIYQKLGMQIEGEKFYKHHKGYFKMSMAI